MKIIQITDIHIDKIDHLTNGINTQANFLNVLNQACEAKPDIIVITGDVCHVFGNIEVYQWLKVQMDDCGYPYYLIAGNHDNQQEISDTFGYSLNNEEIYYEIENSGHRFLFLDTAISKMSVTQFEWLTERLKTRIDAIFMHHPPIKAGLPHMDENYSFLQSEEFIKKCSTYHGELLVFCGHYHCERSIHFENLRVFITPSTFLQIK